MNPLQPTTLFARVAASLASTFAQERVENPYAKAVLAPLAESLALAVLENLPLQPLMPGNPAFVPIPTGFAEGCLRQLPPLAKAQGGRP